jgi:hypothetical protein
VAFPDETRPDSRRLDRFVAVVLVVAVLATLFAVALFLGIHAKGD